METKLKSAIRRIPWWSGCKGAVAALLLWLGHPWLAAGLLIFFAATASIVSRWLISPLWVGLALACFIVPIPATSIALLLFGFCVAGAAWFHATAIPQPVSTPRFYDIVLGCILLLLVATIFQQLNAYNADPGASLEILVQLAVVVILYIAAHIAHGQITPGAISEQKNKHQLVWLAVSVIVRGLFWGQILLVITILPFSWGLQTTLAIAAIILLNYDLFAPARPNAAVSPSH